MSRDKPLSRTAVIRITFDREVVFCKNGEWRWRVILKETNGVGVELNDIVMELHWELGIIRIWSDRDWLESINSRLSPLRSVMSSRFMRCDAFATHAIFIVTGVDDNGHPVVAEGRVDLSLAETPEGETQKDGGDVAEIQITFDPDSVTCKDNKYIWKVFLTEVNGIGVHLKEITREAYIRDKLDDTTTVDNDSNQWSGFFLKELFPPDAYLPAHGSLDFKTGFPYGSVTRQYTHCIFIVIGIDDNGNEVRAEGRVGFVQ